MPAKNPFRLALDEVTDTTAAAHLTHRFSPSSDGWVHLVPIGTFPHLTGPQKITAEDVAVVVQDFQDEGRPALIDLEHESHDPAKRTTAAGWVEEMQQRADGGWGRVKWSRLGDEEISAGHYRYLSPTLNSVKDAEGNWRPKRLRDVGLTNQPNMRSLKPIAHRAAGDSDAANNEDATLRTQGTGARGNGPAPAKTASPVPPPMSFPKSFAALGLADGSTDDAVLAKITALQNSNRALTESQADADLARFAHAIAPDKKDAVRSALLANRDGTLAVLGAVPVPAPVKADPKPAHVPLSHRVKAGTPDAAPLSATGDNEQADKQEQLIRETKLSHRCSYQEAHDIARTLRPELFTAAPEAAAA